MERQDNGDRNAEQLALALAWFSIALGVAELTAPRSVARLIGVPEDSRHTGLLRAMGARELASGLGILAQPRSAAWLWSRVGGDMMDLAYLGSAMGTDGADSSRVAAASAGVMGVTALDLLAARALSQQHGARSRRVAVEHSITVNRAIEDVYRIWRSFDRFPSFMGHLEAVDVIDQRRSRWRARGPAGTSFEWEAEIVEDVEPERIAWRSVEGSDVETVGSVHFERAPGARGTEVHVQLQYEPPAGAAGRAIAWLFGEEPDQQVRDDLRRFKQIAETGEVVLSDGPGLWRPAQPPTHAEDIRSLAGVHP